jgi:hypothetical protein
MPAIELIELIQDGSDIGAGNVNPAKPLTIRVHYTDDITYITVGYFGQLMAPPPAGAVDHKKPKKGPVLGRMATYRSKKNQVAALVHFDMIVPAGTLVATSNYVAFAETTGQDPDSRAERPFSTS